MSLAVGAPGAYTLVIKPTARVLAALRRGRVLEVTVSTRFSKPRRRAAGDQGEERAREAHAAQA